MSDDAPEVLLRSEHATGRSRSSSSAAGKDHRSTTMTSTRPSTWPRHALLVITPVGFERYVDRIAGTERPPEAAKPIPEVVTAGPSLDVNAVN